MRNNCVVKDGQLHWWVIVFILMVGGGLIFLSVKLDISYVARILLWGAGMVCMSIGGFSGRSSGMGLRPFDTAPWRRAKKTYSHEKTYKSGEENDLG